MQSFLRLITSGDIGELTPKQKEMLEQRAMYEGTGLGLSIVKRVIVKYGVDIKSELGCGTTVTLSEPKEKS